jgi:hypothetical protein
MRIVVLAALAVLVAGCGAEAPRTLHLTCADSRGAPADLSTLESPVRVGRLYLPDLRAAAGARLVPWGDGLGWKQYAIVARGSDRPVALTLLDAGEDAGLLYGAPADPSTYRLDQAYERVEFGSCAADSAGYPGGIVVRRPRCVRLRVDGALAEDRELTVPIGVRDCASD